MLSCIMLLNYTPAQVMTVLTEGREDSKSLNKLMFVMNTAVKNPE